MVLNTPIRRTLFLVCFIFHASWALGADNAGNDSATLYRLLNEFRTRPAPCVDNGTTTPPPLAVSPLLENAARSRATGVPLAKALNKAGNEVSYAKLFVVGGASIHQSFDRIVQRYCDKFADPGFNLVGAVRLRDRWWIVLGHAEEAVSRAAVEKISPKPAVPVDAKQFLDLVNQTRSRGIVCGDKPFPPAKPLAWNPQLAEAARKFARDMSLEGFYSHPGIDGTWVWDRVASEGYVYQAVGENIAKNPFGIHSIMESWLKSPEHCVNIMDPDFSDMGAAYDTPYGVLVFGRR